MKRCLFLFIGEVNVTINVDTAPKKQSIKTINKEYFTGFFNEKYDSKTY